MKTQKLLITLVLFLAACAPQNNQPVQKIADDTTLNISCKSSNLEESFWDGMKEYLIQEQSLLKPDQVKQAFASSLQKLQQENPKLSPNDFAKLQGQLDELIDMLLVEGPQGERVETADELFALLSALDVGDRSTDFRSYMQTKVRHQWDGIQKTIQAMDLACDPNRAAPAKVEELTVTQKIEMDLVAKDYDYHKLQAINAGVSLASFGGRWAVATAYQSCQSVVLPPMTAQTPDLQGIAIVGTHKDGVGSRREVASLSSVNRTHYYTKDMSSYGQGCFDLHKSPLIYDYGGKPYVTTSSGSPINLFKNAGSGTSVLGIDCSAFVFTSLASAGLRLKSGRSLKASDASAWGSGSYVEPEKNGMSCLGKISVSPTSQIKSGDIVAVYGHVILIDKVGQDPFGLSKVRSASDCDKISSGQFDFVVAQSSPSKSAIGINYFEARDYLPTSTKMQVGLQKYAYYACLAKFNKKTYTPNLGTLSVIRHRGGSSCTSTRVKLTNESCISSCGSLLR